MSLRIECIRTDEGFAALKDSWNALLEAREDAHIFSSFDWMKCWWDVFKDQYQQQLYILCVYESGDSQSVHEKSGSIPQDKTIGSTDKLIGLAPFHISKGHPHSFVMGKTLFFLGNGEADNDKIISQYNDIICLPGKETEVCELVANYLQDHKKDWDLGDFQFLLKDALIHRCFKTHEKNWLTGDKTIQGHRYTIPRVKTMDEYLASLKKRWSKMYRKKNRLLERDGVVSIKTTDTKDSVDDALALLANMHRERWRNRVSTVRFDSERFYRFHHEILKKLAPQDKAFIKTLYLDDEPLASYYIFACKNQIYYYQSGFYTKYANRYSPLFLLVCKEIGVACEQNKLFDFMYSDDDNSYKQIQYGAQPEAMYRLLVSPSKRRIIWFKRLKTLKELYLKFCEAMKPKHSKKANNKKRHE